MAHLWIFVDGSWKALTLAAASLDLAADPLAPVSFSRAINAAGRLLPLSGSTEEWALLSASDSIRVNGERLALGLKALSDRDEILLRGGIRLFYSTEMLPMIGTFAAGETPKFCPRCLQQLNDGDATVVCPTCKLVYHQSSELPCWTYPAPCSCGRVTSLDASFCWSPDEL